MVTESAEMYRPPRRDVWAAYVVDAATFLLTKRTREIVREGVRKAVYAEMTRKAPAPALRINPRRKAKP